MLLSLFGKLESVEKIATECLASMVLEQTVPCAGPCLCQSTYYVRLFDAEQDESN